MYFVVRKLNHLRNKHYFGASQGENTYGSNCSREQSMRNEDKQLEYATSVMRTYLVNNALISSNREQTEDKCCAYC